jgi:hypothetical protein
MAAEYHKVDDSDVELEFDGIEAVGAVRGLPLRRRSTLRRLCNGAHVLYAMLLLSNLLFVGLWLRTRDEQCIRPKLVYCTRIASRHLSIEGLADLDSASGQTGRHPLREEGPVSQHRARQPLCRPPAARARCSTEPPDRAYGHPSPTYRGLTGILALIIQVSAAELAPLRDQSIQLRDGSAYIVEPAVYHELHCIARDRPRQTD